MERAEFGQTILVGMADLVVLKNQDAFLYTQPLGACLGVAIHDPVTHVGGLLHSLLPEAAMDPQRAATRPAFFIDSGFKELIARALGLGAMRENLRVYAAGGGRIIDETSGFNVGGRNNDVLVRELGLHGLKLTIGDFGGLSNRALYLNPATGEVRVKLCGEPEMKILCKRLTTT